MPVIFAYLIKLSICLAIMYLFYFLVLRRLTFYNHNRWYLAGYSVLCFFISFINIGVILEGRSAEELQMVQYIPTVHFLQSQETAAGLATWSAWNWTLAIVVTGIFLMLLRLMLQLWSFRKIKRGAKLIVNEEVRFYQVEADIMPFSFGNSIFINQQLHTEDELRKIIGHEFVHVKQRHTIDIVWSEILCILNWYNPFAWLIKKAIRQNLEFIADNKVIQAGMDKRQYQYLLLKVVGNNQFSIASQFNFTSLKKRIAMMNKIKSARIQLVKFLFIVPLVGILLLAFRDKNDDAVKDQHSAALQPGTVALQDTIPASAGWHPAPSPGEKSFIERHPSVDKITWAYITASTSKQPAGKEGDAVLQVQLKNGDWDMYNLSIPSSVEKFRRIYREDPPVAPAAPANVEKVVIGYRTPETATKLAGINIVSDKNTPLYIVDGKEMGADAMQHLKGEDIKTINIYKGESATAQYGDKAINGVIDIKTKANATPSGKLIVAADSIAWNSKELVLSGNASLTDTRNKSTVTSNKIVINKTAEKSTEPITLQLKGTPVQSLKLGLIQGQRFNDNDAEVKELRPKAENIINTNGTVNGFRAIEDCPPAKPVKLQGEPVKGTGVKTTGQGLTEVTVIGYPTKPSGNKVSAQTGEVKEITVQGYRTKPDDSKVSTQTGEVKEITVQGYRTKPDGSKVSTQTGEVKEITVEGHFSKKATIADPAATTAKKPVELKITPTVPEKK